LKALDERLLNDIGLKRSEIRQHGVGRRPMIGMAALRR
jgi:uncharacterized protein YjiS (DUF1127 family)